MRIRWSVAVALAAVLAACGGSSTSSKPHDQAVAAMKTFVMQTNNRQWGPQWDALVSEQRPFVTRDRYISCKGKADTGVGVSYDKTITTFDETVNIPGTDVSKPSVAVTAQITISQGSAKQTQNLTAHWFDEAGAWRWSLDDESITAYKAGHCP
jgi:hypothetical protein